MRRLLVAIVIVTATFSTTRARPVDDVEDLEANLEYEKALDLAEKTIARGQERFPSELAHLHLEAGKVAAGLGRTALAEDHFARALAIDPSLVLPTGSSPKLMEPFNAAGAASRPVRIDARVYGARGTVELEDVLHMVASIHIEYIDDKARRPGDMLINSGPPFVYELPGSSQPRVFHALDEFGNVVAFYAVGVGTDRNSFMSLARKPTWYASWKLWAASAGFAGGIAGLCAWRESVAQDDWNRLKNDPIAHDYSQLRAIEDRGRSWALATNIGFGVAGAASVVGAIMFATHRDEPRVMITAAPGAIGVVGRF